MAERLNATCAICNTKYHVCGTCKNAKATKPWRAITDTIDCYKIYLIIRQYTNGAITGETARKQLQGCTLPDTFQAHIKTAIDEILAPDTKQEETTERIRKLT
ncbi:MAG: hypothetical protein K2P65_00450 [Lachnospiraceae bacterium]|nr:hypothetical protein [Lachnospiraceae bacterium]